MSSRTLTAIAPDGTEHSIHVSGDYTYAGLASDGGGWSLMTKGYSRDSVLSRTRTAAGSATITVTPLYDRAQLRVIKYFRQTECATESYGHITHLFTLGLGWHQTGGRVRLDLATLKRLGHKGVTHITVAKDNRTPDFTIAELTRVDRRPALGGSLIGSRTF